MVKDKKFDEVKVEGVKESKRDLDLEKLRKVKSEEDSFFDTYKNLDYESLLTDAYTQLDVAINMVLEKISFGAIIEGSAGIGKTYRVISACSRYKDLKTDYISGFTTPASLFIKMYSKRNYDVLILDDVAQLLSSPKNLAFFKSALWDLKGERWLEYDTTKNLKDEFGELVPRRFKINARIIIITNNLPKSNPDIEAVKSRISYVKIELPHSELLNILRQVAKSYEPTDFKLSESERLECYDFLVANSSECNARLDIRVLVKIFQYKAYSNLIKDPRLWMTWSLNLLQQDDRLVIVKTLLADKNFDSEEARVTKFFELTGDSRPTYFRLKKKLEDKSKVVV